MRRPIHTATEDLLEIVTRHYEHFSTLPTRPGKLQGDVAAVSAMLDCCITDTCSNVARGADAPKLRQLVNELPMGHPKTTGGN
jgi:hypothetical protein